MNKSLRSTPEKKRRFLAKYKEIGNITKAAEYAGIHPTTHHKRWMKKPDYVKQFEAAKLEAIDNLEAEAYRRAHDGVDEPVFYRGEEVGAVRKYSDTLLIFLLKGANPAKYRERYDVSAKVELGGNVNIYLPDNGRGGGSDS